MLLTWLVWLAAAQTVPQPVQVPAAPGPPRVSACHVFIDHQFIWTLEVVKSASGAPSPILNIITFLEGQWDLRPKDIHLINGAGREAEVEKFSIDTGVVEDPYLLRYLKVHGDSFIGLDLLGDFRGFETLAEVSIDLGDSRFILEPVDCLEFENVVHQINQINYDTPDIRQDYEVLRIELKGRREARRRFY
jgi:hypothetical protein